MDARDRMELMEMAAGRGSTNPGVLARALDEVLRACADHGTRITALENPAPVPPPPDIVPTR